MKHFTFGGYGAVLHLSHRVIMAWALLGGTFLLCAVMVNVVSVVGGIFAKPLSGDFELTEILVAISAFMFLPYCQLHGSNVSADIFTTKASPRWIAICKLFASLVAMAFSITLVWRMWLGMLDQREYGYTTPILQIQHWWAFIPILISLGLLVFASILTTINTLKKNSIHKPETDSL